MTVDELISAYIELDAESDEDALAAVRDVLDVESAGLSADDGYDVGDLLYALVWDEDGIVVDMPTHEITADDLS